MRSESVKISSSSAETRRTAVPSSRISTMRRWMNSMEPTSRPRVGCATRSTLTSPVSSRAMITFCWFPPESVWTPGAMPEARTSKRRISSRRLLLDRAVAGGSAGGRTAAGSRCSAPGCRRWRTGRRRRACSGLRGRGPTPCCVTRAGRRGGEVDAVDHDAARDRRRACPRSPRRTRAGRCPRRPRSRGSRPHVRRGRDC